LQALGAPHYSLWHPGEPVIGSSSVPGTCIATFDKLGHYDDDQRCAIYIGRNEDGLIVMDQLPGMRVRTRSIPMAEAQTFYIVEA
jgi:hypothetical protein